MLRYRTETFSGIGPRDAAEVMAFETFELGNTDIPEYLCSHQLKGSSLAPALESITRELDDNGFVDDMSWEEKVDFFREVLEDLSKVTGVNISHALWLADPDTVLNFYGKELTTGSYIDAYEPGPVVLTDLGHDGRDGSQGYGGIGAHADQGEIAVHDEDAAGDGAQGIFDLLAGPDFPPRTALTGKGEELGGLFCGNLQGKETAVGADDADELAKAHSTVTSRRRQPSTSAALRSRRIISAGWRRAKR